MHAGLRTLIATQPLLTSRPTRIDWSQSALLGNRTSLARDFADQVADRLVGNLLSWSDRQTLLASAGNLGISPFEANLIIAAVQQHLSQSPRPARPAANFPLYPSRRWATIAYGVATFLLVQGIILAAGWHLLF